MIIPGGFFAATPVSGAPPVPFFMIGMLPNGMLDVVSAGDLPGVAASFDFDVGEVNALYQRYRIYDTGEAAEVQDIVVVGIMGNYAVCMEQPDGTPDNKLFITPYLTDGSIVLESEWVDDYTLNIGAGVTAISPGEFNEATGIIPVAVDQFVIVSGLVDYTNQTSYDLKIVTFSSPTSVTITTATIDLDELISPVESEWNLPEWAPGTPFEVNDETIVASDGYVYTCLIANTGENPPDNIDTYWQQTRPARQWSYLGTGSMSAATNPNNAQIAVSMQLHVFGPYYGGSITLNIDGSTGALSNKSLNLYGGEGDFVRRTVPLYRMSPKSLSVIQTLGNGTDLYDNGSGVKSEVFEGVVTYSTYTSITTGTAGDSIVTVFGGASGDTVINLNDALEDKLVALGYTVVDDVTFGEPAYYLDFLD